jgi:spermidine synthase
VKILETGNGKYDVVVRDMSNPSGGPTTVIKDATERYIQNKLANGIWE